MATCANAPFSHEGIEGGIKFSKRRHRKNIPDSNKYRLLWHRLENTSDKSSQVSASSCSLQGKYRPLPKSRSATNRSRRVWCEWRWLTRTGCHRRMCFSFIERNTSANAVLWFFIDHISPCFTWLCASVTELLLTWLTVRVLIWPRL